MAIKQHIKNILNLGGRNWNTIKGFLQLSSLRMLQILLGLVTTYFLAHTLSIEEYGEYQFLLSVMGFLSICSLTEFGNTLMQSVARGYTGSFKKMLPYTFLCSLSGSFILLIFAFWYGDRDDHLPFLICFIFGAVCLPFMHGISLWRSFKIGEQNFSSFSRIEGFNLVLTHASIILMTILYEGQYILPFMCFSLIPSLTNIFMTTRTWRRIPKEAPSEEGVIPHGLQSSFFASFFIASMYMDKLLLFFFLSPSALALFAVADRLSELLRTGVQDMASALAPKFAQTKNYTERMDRIFKIFCVLFGAVLIVFAFTLLPHLIILIYGEKFAASIPYAQALVIAQAIGNLATIQFRYIRSKLDTKNFRNIITTTSLCRMAISLILVPSLGLIGAVLSAFLYRLFLSFSIHRIIKREYKIAA